MSNVLDFQVNGLFPSTVGGLGGTVKYFQRILGTNGPNSGPNTNISATNAAGALFVPANGSFNAQQMNVLVTGTMGFDTADASGTVQITLYGVTGTAAAPVYTDLASTGALTPKYAGGDSWAIDAVLYGDNQTGLVGGYYTAMQNGAAIGSKAAVSTDNVLTGVAFDGIGNSSLLRGAAYGLVVGVTFGTSAAGNTASMYQFTIES